MLLNILVPVYNEGENFENLYNEIKSKIHTNHKILVIYDFDQDNTLPVVGKFQKNNANLFLVKNFYGRGVLNALRTGFQSATSGPCLVIMGDLSDDLSIVDKMVEKYNQGYKIVCGSRYVRGGKQIGGPLVKKTFSKLAGISLHYLSGIKTRDITNNFKLYDKKLLDEITIESKGGFEIAMEITSKAFKKKYKICDIPTTWHDRTAGQSRFKLLKWLPLYLKWYFYALGW